MAGNDILELEPQLKPVFDQIRSLPGYEGIVTRRDGGGQRDLLREARRRLRENRQPAASA